MCNLSLLYNRPTEVWTQKEQCGLHQTFTRTLHLHCNLWKSLAALLIFEGIRRYLQRLRKCKQDRWQDFQGYRSFLANSNSPLWRCFPVQGLTGFPNNYLRKALQPATQIHESYRRRWHEAKKQRMIHLRYLKRWQSCSLLPSREAAYLYLNIGPFRLRLFYKLQEIIFKIN